MATQAATWSILVLCSLLLRRPAAAAEPGEHQLPTNKALLRPGPDPDVWLPHPEEASGAAVDHHRISASAKGLLPTLHAPHQHSRSTGLASPATKERGKPTLTLTADSGSELVNGGWVTASWSNVKRNGNPDLGDPQVWIGVFSTPHANLSVIRDPADPVFNTSYAAPPWSYTAPVKYAAADPGLCAKRIANGSDGCIGPAPALWTQSYGSYRFHMTNMGDDALVALFSCGQRTEWCLKDFEVLATAKIAFADADRPRQVHLARTVRPNEILISWTSPYNDAQTVEWNVLNVPAKWHVSDPAVTSTYTRSDVCGVPASTQGWQSPGFLHHATVSLDGEDVAGQWINYTVGSALHGRTPPNTFKAPRSPGMETPVRVIAMADLGYGHPDHASGHMVYPNSTRTTTHAAKFVEGADLVLHNGDIAYATGYLTCWEKFMSQIEPLASRLPYMTSQGNHERDFGLEAPNGSIYRLPHDETAFPGDTGGSGPKPTSPDLKYGGHPSGGECGVPMQSRFVMPTPEGVSADDGWYSFDQGSIHFITIATEMHCGPNSRQLTWVEQDLSSVNRSLTPWIILMGHRQMYASSYNCPFGPWQVCCVDDSSLCRGANALEPLLMKYKVDLAMWGHVHFAELSCPMVDGKCVSKQDAEGYDAPIHAVIGNGGPQEPSATTKADWSRYLDHDNGFTVLTSHNSSLLSIEFYGDEPDLDKLPPMKFRHDIVRHRGGQPHPRPSPPPSPPPHPPPSPSPAPPAPPPTSQPSLVNLFPVHSNNMSCYFAPLLLRVPRTNVLIALAEARMFSCNDGGAKRIAMRRSEDNGQSWAATQWIWNDTSLSTLPTDTERWAQWLAMGGENFTGSNFGTIFYDDQSDVLSLYFTYGTSVESAVDMLIITSADHGASWDTNPPRNVTDIIRNGPPQADGSTIKDFYGLVGGIQLQHGKHKGRLVLPGYAITTHHIEQHYAAGAGVMFSDDRSESWEVGMLMMKNDQFSKVGYDTQPSESTVVELSNGSLLLNIRDSLNVLDGQQPDRCGCRLLARSDDGGKTFVQFWNDPVLESGNCEAHMVSSRGERADDTLWFVNPRARIGSTPEDDGRVNGTLYYSQNQGARGSWRVAGRVPGQLFPGTNTFNFGYSMMALLDTTVDAITTTQSIGVLYQNGWTENRGGHYEMVCSDPCCSPSAAHPETSMCGVVFATMSATIPYSPTPSPSPSPPPLPPPPGKGAGKLKWLGCSDDYMDQYKGALNMLAENSDISTAVNAKRTLGVPSFWGDSCFPGATNCSGSGGPVMGPHGCLKNGGCWKLTADWELQVVAKVASIKSLIANKTVVGIAMGDEMVCNGLPFENFTALVKKVRAEVGPGVPLWANECCGTITGNAAPGQWPYIPAELDIISYDCYTVPADKPPHFWNGTEEAVMTRSHYESWYHLLHPHQKAAVLPGLFGWNTSKLPKAAQSEALVDKLRGFLAWAQEDDKLVAMVPWHMNDRSAAMGVNMGPGAVDFPAVMAQLRAINKLL